MGSIENPGGGPHRDPSSQWYVTLEEWPSEKYPPWAHGAGYVISQVNPTCALLKILWVFIVRDVSKCGEMERFFSNAIAPRCFPFWNLQISGFEAACACPCGTLPLWGPGLLPGDRFRGRASATSGCFRFLARPAPGASSTWYQLIMTLPRNLCFCFSFFSFFCVILCWFTFSVSNLTVEREEKVRTEGPHLFLFFPPKGAPLVRGLRCC